MRYELVKIIKILGIDCHELVIDIDLGYVIVNSIEYDIDTDSILLHNFITSDGDEYDIEMDYDELSDDDQKIIYTSLSQFTYN